MSNGFSAVHLDSVFLNKYLGTVPDFYISVYICAKACESCDSAFIAQKLSADGEKTAEAISFWREKGEIEEKKEKKHFSFDERPVYYAEELKIYAEKNEYVRKMFDAAQKYLGRLLTHSDLSAILSFHHWLGLEPDAVEVLLRYCSEKGHRNMRYIERVAIDWAENEILTKEQAEERIRLYNTDYRAIMRAMGQSGRNPVAAEEKYMKAWLEEMKMPLELIELACEKTVMNTGKASFGYANRIISDWKSKGFKTVDEVRKAESEFAAQKAKTAQTQKQMPKKNAFLNYQQRDYDFDEIERLEYEKNRRENL